VKSPFSKVIATRYYDGSLEGFLQHSGWPEACVFRLLDWDRERDLRVFEVAYVEGTDFEDVVEQLFEERQPTWPVWVLPRHVVARAEALLRTCFDRAKPLAVVTARDICMRISHWEPAPDEEDNVPTPSQPISSGFVMPEDKARSQTGSHGH
jgi:hypothetical protein